MKNPFSILVEGFFVATGEEHFGSRRLSQYRNRSLRFGVVAMLFCLFLTPLFGQPNAVEEELFEIDKIEFRGNATFGADALRETITLKETPSGFSKFMYRTFGEKLGSKPEFFDKLSLDTDEKRLKEFYKHRGFYLTTVTNTYTIDSNAHRTRIYFIIQENKRSYIDSVRVEGLELIPLNISQKVFNEPVLQKGMPYESDKAAVEINRIRAILYNNGYASARLDTENSAAVRYTSTNNFFLRYVFITGAVRHFGNTSVRVEPPREDITDDLALRELDFQPGDLYSREKIISSEGNLNRLGLFETATIDSSGGTDSVSSSAIPMVVSVRPRPRNELSPELIVSDENNALNLGVGLGYANHNFFGDARTFTTSARARTQSIRELFAGRGFRDTTVIAAINLEFQILQPFLFTRTLSGSWTSSISAEKQNFYTLFILRNKIGLSKRFATYTYGFLDWTLERVKTEYLVDTAQFGNVTGTLPPENQPQFNSILTFTLQRDKTNDIFSPTDGFFNSISLEESGILPKLLKGLGGGLPFTQYYKISSFGRWYHDLTSSKFNILALKLKGGYQDKYGESRSSDVSIPLNRRFFGGGSGSVRGWKARELGAMSDELLQFGGNFIFEGSAEMRVNHFRGFGKLGFLRMENIWAVYFLDVGNVWSDISDVKPKDIAIAAGLGFRYETIFGPFRVDYGFRVYDPKGPVGHKSMFQKQFFGEVLANAVFHIGIGHAF